METTQTTPTLMHGTTNMKIGQYTSDKEWFSPEVLAKLKAKNIPPRWLLDIRIVNAVDEIREHFNKPILLNHSGLRYRGFRTSEENESIESTAEFSQHQYGRAADITIPGVEPRAVADFASTLGLFTKTYKAWTHIDTRWL